MKIIILILCFLIISFSADAGTRVFYKGEEVTGISDGSPVAGALYYNDDSPDYVQKKNLIETVSRRFLKVVNGELVEISQAEKDIILQAEENARIQSETDRINNSNITIKELIEALDKLNIIVKKDVLDEVKNSSNILTP
ncbi:MAG TPA: hypothetical protein ENH85_14085 [Candidatus Scalindua sp.]|nr:hypothetical protein [Candidatus Scalindua sp.]